MLILDSRGMDMQIPAWYERIHSDFSVLEYLVFFCESTLICQEGKRSTLLHEAKSNSLNSNENVS